MVKSDGHGDVATRAVKGGAGGVPRRVVVGARMGFFPWSGAWGASLSSLATVSNFSAGDEDGATGGCWPVNVGLVVNVEGN